MAAVPMKRINLKKLNFENCIANNANARFHKGPASKCLFGPADAKHTQELLEEQFKIDRQRFFDRFGINVEDLENVAVDESSSPKKRKSAEKIKAPTEKASKLRRVLKPYNSQQTKMTDFCTIKKSAVSGIASKKL